MRDQAIDLATARMSADCRRKLTAPSEGTVLKAYRDCVGIWTIGTGHTGMAGGPPVHMGMTITAAEADDVLSNDLRVFEKGVATMLKGAKVEVLQREFDALVDLAFNIGLGAFRGSSLLRAYVAGDKATACRKFADWNRAGGKVVPGLVARRRREQLWFMDGRLDGRTTAVGLIGEQWINGPAMPRLVDHPDAPRPAPANDNSAADDREPFARVLLVYGLLIALCLGALFAVLRHL